MEVAGQLHAPAALLPIVQETGWASESAWTGAKNLAVTGIRSPDRASRSEWLYYYPSPLSVMKHNLRKTSFSAI